MGAGQMRLRQPAEDVLGPLLAEVVVEVAVVEVEPFDGEPRVLEDVPAGCTAIQGESPWLVLEQVAVRQVLDELPSAQRAVRKPRLEEPIETTGQQLLVDRTLRLNSIVLVLHTLCDQTEPAQELQRRTQQETPHETAGA